MAEYVQARLEETIPELEQLQRIKLFEKHEIKAIANKRKEFEYKLQRLTKRKEDYVRYIQYELDLLKLISVRRAKSRMFIKHQEIEHAIVNRVDKLFKKVIQRFPSDVRLWITHIKFCKGMGFTSAISGIFVRMLAIHSDKPNVWKFAASWEYEKSDSVENARNFLLRGLRFHPTSELLRKEAITMELKHAQRGRDDKAERDAQIQAYGGRVKTEETEDPVLQGRLAEVFFESTVDNVDSVKFYVDLLHIATQYDFAENLQCKIINHLLSAYRTDELVWDLMARRELVGYSLDHKHVAGSGGAAPIPKEDFNVKEERSLKKNINMCLLLYHEALKVLPSERMWTFYVDMLVELNRDPSELPKYKEQLLFAALEDADAAGMLSEKYYPQWMDILVSRDLQHKCIPALERAIERFPASVALWREYLGQVLRDGDGDPMAVFNRAATALGAQNHDALPLWAAIIQHYQENDKTQAEAIFEKAMRLGTSISSSLKPLYLDWLNIVKGITAVRAKHATLSLYPPLCLELHSKMIELEVAQPKVNTKEVRKCYNLATHQFGKNDYDLWLDYIKFELSQGEAKHVSSIYDRAIKTLAEEHLQLFISKYSLMKSGTSL